MSGLSAAMASNGAPASAPVPTGGAPRRPRAAASSQAIAEQFSHQYYTVFSNYPRYLHRFYDQASTQTIVEIPENGPSVEETATTQQEINDVISRWFPETRARVEQVSSQFSLSGGVMLQVSGIMQRRGLPDSNFVQSFFLAVQERGFFVLNDLLRITPVLPSTVRHQHPRNEPNHSVPQPQTPRDGMSPFGPVAPATMHSNGIPMRHSAPDSEQINQILAETKNVLSSTIPATKTETGAVGQQQTYSGLLRRSSATMHGTPVEQSPHGQPASPFHSTEGMNGQETVPQSPAEGNNHSAFLLNTRRRSSTNGGGLPVLQQNTSIFVRDLPNNIDEKGLREVFEQFGAVTSVMIRTGKRESRFAFVDFTEVSAMEKALTADLTVSGRRLLIEEKKPLVLRHKPRFSNQRTNGDGIIPGMADGNGGSGYMAAHGNSGHARGGPNACR